MINRLLAGVAGVILISGVTYADQYPPAPPPSMPLAPPPVGTSPGEVNPPGVAPGPGTSTTAVPPSVGVPGSTTTTTTTSPTTNHTTKTTKGVDANGNEITKKETYREGVAGSSESHKTTVTDPDGGTTTTRPKSNTKQE